DAGSKQLAALPELAQDEVGLELAGLDSGQIDRVMAGRRRRQGRAALEAVAAVGVAREQGQSAAAAATEDAQRLKVQFEALGLGGRAGVAPTEAAAGVGLPGIKLPGAVPGALRMPEDGARRLEEK